MTKPIEEIYSIIESTNKLNDSYQCVKNLNEKVKDDTDEQVIKIIDLERILLSFSLKKGNLGSNYSEIGRDGVTIFEYPTLTLLKEDDINYIKKRANTVINPLLKIRYNQILWNFNQTKRDFNLAKLIVDESLELLSLMKLTKDSANEFNVILFNATLISIGTSYKKDIVKKVFLDTLDSIDSDLYWIAIHILEFMHENSNFFKPVDFENVESLLKKFLNDIKLTNYEHFLGESFFYIAEKISQKTKSEPKFWFNEAGFYAEYWAEKRMEDDESRISVISFLKQALINFRNAGNETKINETLLKLQNVDVQLGEIKIPLGEKEQKIFDKVTDIQVKEFLQFSGNDFYKYLATYKTLIPSVKQIGKAIEDSPKSSFMDFAKSYSYDINGNVSDGDSPQNRRFGIFYEVYINTLFHLLWKLFYDGIKSNKITYESLFKYLIEESWIGASYNQNHSKKAKKNWILLLSPAIFQFFLKYSFFLQSLNDFTLIVEIDSLVLKVEGLLRELIQKNGHSTQALNKDGSAIREVPLEDLLSRQIVKDILGEDETYFIRYVLSNTGMNLRNKIAHCYFNYDNYSPIHAIVLIFIIIRLSKFQYTTVETD